MASGFTTLTNEHLIRDQIYSRDVTRMFEDELFAMRFVNTITDFPDGNTFNKPRLGQAETADFAEGQAIKYNKFDTGNFTFDIDQYKVSANAISAKFMRDSFWAPTVRAAFVPEQHRALMKTFETRVFDRANAGQTASDTNTINNAAHRWVANGTSEVLSIKDFQLARFALRKANVPLNNLVAILDPSSTYAIESQANVVNLMTPSGQWADSLLNGLSNGFQWRFNIAGFDVFESNYLPNSIAETIGARSVTTGVANMFFSAAPGDTLPWVAAFRQMPKVESEWNKDLQQEEILTICEYGVKLYRPENMVIVLSDTDQVS